MQKRVIKMIGLLLTLILLMASVTASAKRIIFLDVPEDAWEADYVYELVDRGIVGGYGDGNFGPNLPVQRCEYAKMLVGLTKTPISTSVSTPYVDVPDDQWFFPYVNSSLSFITGFTRDGELWFDPEENATREDVTVALIKALKMDVSGYVDTAAEYLGEKFSDLDSISVHNRPYIMAAVKEGYITGDTEGTFRGQDTIIRAEVVAILCRAFPK